jgi:hypothetical protein
MVGFSDDLLDVINIQVFDTPENETLFRASISVSDTSFQTCADLLEYRDAAEDILTAYGVHADFVLPKAGKPDMAGACAKQVQDVLQKHARGNTRMYKMFVIDKACKEWMRFTDPFMTMRPRVKTPVPVIERVLADMETQPWTTGRIAEWASDLHVSELPVLSMMWCLSNDVDVDDAFMNAPKSTVRGSCCILRDMHNGVADVKRCKAQSPDINRPIIVQNGSIKIFHSDGKHVLVKEPCAYYGVPVPGTELITDDNLRRYIVVAKDSTAAILEIRYAKDKAPSVKRMFEMDLEETRPIDFLDCQRDRDANIVLIWGHRAEHTGGADLKYFALSHEDFMNKKVNMAPFETSKLPNRSLPGTRIDFRDHGNLLALVDFITEGSDDTKRTFQLNQHIVYGSTAIGNAKLPERMFAVFGAPTQYVALGVSKNIWSITQSSHTKALSVDIVPSDVTSMIVFFS